MTKQGQQTVVATEPRNRDGGNREAINVRPSCDLESRVRFLRDVYQRKYAKFQEAGPLRSQRNGGMSRYLKNPNLGSALGPTQ